MTDLLKEIHDISLFVQMLLLVACYTGLAAVPVVLLAKNLVQAYLMRNIAGRSMK